MIDNHDNEHSQSPTRHETGHLQVLVKDSIVVAVLVFSEHDDTVFNSVFNSYTYDEVVNLCSIENFGAPALNASWDGKKFHIKQYSSWVLTSDLTWEAPTPQPEPKIDWFWNEDTKVWVNHPVMPCCPDSHEHN